MKAICLGMFIGTLLAGCSRWDVKPKEFYSSFISGELDTKPYNLYDLDEGTIKGSDKADFYWRVIDKNSFYMAPSNGATIAVTKWPDPVAIPYPELANQSFVRSTITVGINAGSIAYITNEGRYGALRVSNYDFTNSSLKITFITYSR